MSRQNGGQTGNFVINNLSFPCLRKSILSVDDIDLAADINAGINLGGTKDYRKLNNKPSINGIELYDNYDEIDPTVPDWAKQSTKPTYTPEEIGISAIPLTEIVDMFKNW